MRDFDPRTALDGGPDGLDFYRLLAAQAAARLKPGGKIMLEFGDGQAEAIQGLFCRPKLDCGSRQGRLQSTRPDPDSPGRRMDHK